jgi:signal transduction histidine kinase
MPPDWFFHDMRNRLTVARGFVHLLLDGKAAGDPEKQDHFLEIVEESLEDGLRLLEEREKHDAEREGRFKHDGERVSSETHPQTQADVPGLRDPQE